MTADSRSTICRDCPSVGFSRRSRTCPRDTIVLFLTVFRDGAGESFKQPDVVQKVAAASGAPVYSVFGSYFGRGIVGGYMVSFEAVGDQAAAVALRLLSGERPEQVGTALGPEGSYLADASQLQRWSLDESRLPAGTVVRFREPSIWDRLSLAYRCRRFGDSRAVRCSSWR